MDNDFDKNFNSVVRWSIGVWLTIAVGTLAFWGVVIWAIIELVQHFTS